MLFHLLRNVSLLTQHEGFQNAGGGVTCPLLKKEADPIPPTFHVEKEGISEPFANLHQCRFLEGESDGMNSVEGQVAFEGESSRVMKSPGWVKSAPDPQAVSQAKGFHLFFEEEEHAAPDRDGPFPQDNLMRMNQHLDPSFRTERRTKDRSLQGDSIQSVKSGERIRGMFRRKIGLNREDAEKTEENKSHSCSPPVLPRHEEEDP
jgi:hypothetical protein